jgi:hypothetical protein
MALPSVPLRHMASTRREAIPPAPYAALASCFPSQPCTMFLARSRCRLPAPDLAFQGPLAIGSWVGPPHFATRGGA